MQQYIHEYKTEKLICPDEDLEAKLKEWRSEGWEVFSCVKTKHAEKYDYYVNMRRSIDITFKIKK